MKKCINLCFKFGFEIAKKRKKEFNKLLIGIFWIIVYEC